jgi:hypothetical protein
MQTRASTNSGENSNTNYSAQKAHKQTNARTIKVLTRYARIFKTKRGNKHGATK